MAENYLVVEEAAGLTTVRYGSWSVLDCRVFGICYLDSESRL